MTRHIPAILAILLLSSAPAGGLALSDLLIAGSAEGETSRQAELYEEGTEALDDGAWDRAAKTFTEAARVPGDRTDGALYWKAYSLGKLGRRAEAIPALEELRKAFPKSRWSNDARALELELRGGKGVRPETEGDEELKLIALNSLMNSDADRAIPMLEKFLHGHQSPRLKERALFVLAQHGSPRARQIVSEIARGRSNPDLQEKALHYLGLFGGPESRQLLSEIYASSTSVEVRKKILHGFMVAGERGRLLTAARSEKSPELRAEAIHQLGIMGARAELWQMYGSEASSQVKEAIVHSLFLAGDSDRLLELARGEKDPELRREAIRKLGLLGGEQTGAKLIEMYRSARDGGDKEAVIHALFVQGNARALIDIARSEKDRQLREEVVQKLSVMQDKEATEYLLEILNR